MEQVRRLVEEDQVALLFNTLGTPTNSAIVRYVNQKKVPHLFISTGADKFGDYQHFPWTMGFQASQPDQLPSDPADAARKIRRYRLGPLRRRDHRRR